MELMLIGSFLFTGLLLIAVSVPMIRGRVKPNLFYGFRTRKTLSSKEIWYPANRYAGKALAIAGAVQSIVALGLLVGSGSLSLEMEAAIGLVVLLGSLAAAMIPTYLFLRSL